MALFSRNFNKPGPGVRKDEPRKKGYKRFFELLFRDMAELIKLNLLFCIVAAPSAVSFMAAMMGIYPLIFLILSIILAFPIGGALTAYVFYITKLMRDDMGFVWVEVKRKFIENFKQAAIAGILCTVFVYAQILLWGGFVLTLLIEGAGHLPTDIFVYIISAISVLVFSLLTPFLFLHFAYIDIGALKMFKNSAVLAFAYLPRSFMGAVFGLITWVLMLMFLPGSLGALPYILLLGFSVSRLLTLMWVWPVFDKSFDVEETLLKRAEEKIP